MQRTLSDWLAYIERQHPTSIALGLDRVRAVATRLGMGWALLPTEHAAAPLASGELIELAPGRHLDVPLHWQQWNLRSRLIDAVAEEVRAEARRVLG